MGHVTKLRGCLDPLPMYLNHFLTILFNTSLSQLHVGGALDEALYTLIGSEMSPFHFSSLLVVWPNGTLCISCFHGLHAELHGAELLFNDTSNKYGKAIDVLQLT